MVFEMFVGRIDQIEHIPEKAGANCQQAEISTHQPNVKANIRQVRHNMKEGSRKVWQTSPSACLEEIR